MVFFIAAVASATNHLLITNGISMVDCKAGCPMSSSKQWLEEQVQITTSASSLALGRRCIANIACSDTHLLGLIIR